MNHSWYANNILPHYHGNTIKVAKGHKHFGSGASTNPNCVSIYQPYHVTQLVKSNLRAHDELPPRPLSIAFQPRNSSNQIKESNSLSSHSCRFQLFPDPNPEQNSSKTNETKSVIRKTAGHFGRVENIIGLTYGRTTPLLFNEYFDKIDTDEINTEKGAPCRGNKKNEKNNEITMCKICGKLTRNTQTIHEYNNDVSFGRIEEDKKKQEIHIETNNNICKLCRYMQSTYATNNNNNNNEKRQKISHFSRHKTLSEFSSNHNSTTPSLNSRGGKRQADWHSSMANHSFGK